MHPQNNKKHTRKQYKKHNALFCDEQYLETQVKSICIPFCSIVCLSFTVILARKQTLCRYDDICGSKTRKKRLVLEQYLGVITMVVVCEYITFSTEFQILWWQCIPTWFFGTLTRSSFQKKNKKKLAASPLETKLLCSFGI